MRRPARSICVDIADLLIVHARPQVLTLVLLVAAFVTPPAAAAAPGQDAAAIVAAFAALPQGDGGNVIDPVLRSNAYPYSQAMLGDAALWTWKTTGDPGALAFGERMLRWVSEHPSGPTPSFFALGAAARAYESLDESSPIQAPLRQWLIAFPVPTRELVDYATNKDLVLAEALSTLCRHYTVGPAGRRVTVLVDPPHAPPAYQQLVLGYLARIVSRQARRDRTAELALLSTARGTLAMVAPDGDAAYWGRSQEQSWAVILGAYGLRVAARLEPDTDEAARFLAVADAMVGRFARVYRGGPYALWIVPAMRQDPFSRPRPSMATPTSAPMPV